jgi:protein-disulfide isomerase
MLRLLFAAGLLFSCVVQAAEFSPAQRAEIVQIVRDALKQDPSILREAVIALQSDETERSAGATKAALSRARDKLIAGADPETGNPKGDVVIVEFFDIRCPYCKRLEPAMDAFLAQDRKVRLIYKDLPILGPASVTGSKVLLAAQNQGAYVKMRDAVMKMPQDAGLPQFRDAAKSLGLNWEKLLKDMDDPSISARIGANLALAHELQIQGTPAMVIGNELFPGALDQNELKKAVAEARRS